MPLDGTTHPEEVRRILDFFWKIAAVPRCSGREQKIARFLLETAGTSGYPAVTDPAGNVLIRVPAPSDSAGAPTVILQAHMDMVCVSRPGSRHDFTADPIIPVVKDEWLGAEGTTLGADNGIGIALALTAAVSDIPRPPLELLFTVDEERGLTGASALSPEFIRGRTLINLDSEDEGVLTIGCAGGRDGRLTVPVRRTPETDGRPVCVTIDGLAGGHSGVEIDRERANAIRLLASILSDALDGDPDCFRLYGIDGGTAHNAIPSAASAVIRAADPPYVQRNLETLLDRRRLRLNAEDRRVRITAAESPDYAFGPLGDTDARRLLDILLCLPHGITRMSGELPGVVETSSNVALVSTLADSVKVVYSLRSFHGEALNELGQRFGAIARLSGGTAETEPGYPGWTPDFDSPLLGRAMGVYRTLFGDEPRVEVIHAGLECGVIGSRIPGMTMLSIGPTIEEPHTPEERLHLPSLDRFWTFFRALLADLTGKPEKK